ncbi:PIN domain-like protein, partial [Lentinus tigrinus ALCF2SS1-7]
MGVSDLWDIINKAGQSRAISQLAFSKGFEENSNGTRTLRLGIDASIWLHHASYSAGPKGQDRGAKPELRTLLFRLATLSKLPVSVLFVFDGRQRPKVKRGSKMGKSGTHGLARGFRDIIDLFGMDAREALGEAEAELAFLNRSGAIDAIITDDVDSLVFGARMILKNSSINLTGNKCNPATDANGKPSKFHANVYTAEELARHPDVQMSRGGLVLFALLAGGDYGKGLHGCGKDTAHALARLGFGDNLLQAYEHREAVDFPAFLEQWRHDIQQELRTNSHRLMKRAHPNIVVPPDFPPMDQLDMYFDPLTSGRNGGAGGGPPRARRPIDLPGLAHFCEKNFTEWGYRTRILERFNNFLLEGLVMAVLKTAAVEADKREEDRRIRAGAAPGHERVRGLLNPAPHEGVGTSATLVRRCLMPKKITRRTGNDERLAHVAAAFVNRGTPEPEEELRGVVEDVEDRYPLIVGITRTRQHVSTDKMLEYRVEICPRQLVEIANSGITGIHPDPKQSGRARDNDDEMDDEDDDEPGSGGKKRGLNDNILKWIPASIMRQVHPALVEEYEEKVRSKQSKKSPRKR